MTRKIDVIHMPGARVHVLLDYQAIHEDPPRYRQNVALHFDDGETLVAHYLSRSEIERLISEFLSALSALADDSVI